MSLYSNNNDNNAGHNAGHNVIKNAKVRGSLLYPLQLRVRREVKVNEPGSINESGNGNEMARAGFSKREPAAERVDLSGEILKRTEETLREARALKAETTEQLSLARQEAETIKAEARRLADTEGKRLREEARKLGFEQGRREGYQAGMAKAQAEGEEIRAAAQEVLRQAEENRRTTIESLEGSIIGLAQEIAERLMCTQLSLEPEIVCNVAKESLRLLQNRLQVFLYINPEELALYEKNRDELQRQLPPKAELQVITDPAIQPGGCRIDTENGQVDATMEARRSALLQALYGEEV